jgi:peptide/nickel transport system permease protein
MNSLAKLIFIFWIFAFIFNYVMDVDPNYIEPALILSPPNMGNWFGRDDYGRPIFFRLVEGFHNSIEIIFFVTIFTSIIGITVGTLAGYFGGKFDAFISFIINLFMSFPGILLAITFAAMLPAGKLNLIIALSVGGWVGYARLARKIVRHILPALRTPLVVEGTYAIAGLIIAEASLSFLGLGIPAPDPSWGAMMRDSVSYLLVSPHYSVLVGISIMSLVYCINFIGDCLHKYWDIKES